MPGKKANDGYGHVANAMTMDKSVLNAILDSISNKTRSSPDFQYGANDFALQVYRFLHTHGWTKDRLVQLLTPKGSKGKKGKKSKSDDEDMNLLTRELPFLVNTVPEVFHTADQRLVKEKLNGGETLSDEDLGLFDKRKGDQLRRYITLLEQGKAMPGSLVNQVLTGATTEATERLAERLDPNAWREGKLIKTLTSTPKNQSEDEWRKKNASDAKEASLEELSLDQVWAELGQHDSFRSTNVQKHLFRMVLDVMRGKQVASVMSSPTGSGKTFGLCAAVAHFNRLRRNKAIRKLPTFFYKHSCAPVVAQVETHAVEMCIQHCYVKVEKEDVEVPSHMLKARHCADEEGETSTHSRTVRRWVLYVDMSHETVGKLQLRYLLDDDENEIPTCITHRLGGRCGNGQKLPCSSHGEGVNVLSDVHRFVVDQNMHSSKRFGMQTGKAAWPLLWFFRGKETWLLPIMVAQEVEIDDDLHQPVLVADDPFCNPDPHMQAAMIASPNICCLDATVSISGLGGINRERIRRGLLAMLPKIMTDTVGKGIGLTANDERTYDPTPEARAQFSTRVFNPTTLTMSHLQELGARIYGGPKEFRDVVIDMFASGKGLNDIRALIVRRFSEADIDMNVDLPRDVQGTSLVFYDNKQEVLRAVPVYTSSGRYRGTWGEVFGQNPQEGVAYEEECTAKIKALFVDYEKAKAAHKAGQEQLKRQLGGSADDRADAQEELNESCFTFTHELTRAVPRLNPQQIVEKIQGGYEQGVSSTEMMAVLRQNVLVIHRDTPLEFYTSLMYTATKLISDETLGSGIHLPQLKVVSIRNATLSPEQIIQYLGRAGRARQGEGRGAVTEGQAYSAMTDVLGEPFRFELMRNRPWSCTNPLSLNAFSLRIRSYLDEKKRLAREAADAEMRREEEERQRLADAEMRREEEERQRVANQSRLEDAAVRLQSWGRMLLAKRAAVKIAAKLRRKQRQKEKKRKGAEKDRLNKERLERQRLTELQRQEEEHKRQEGASGLSQLLETPEAVAITEARKNSELSIDQVRKMLGLLLPQITACDCNEAVRNEMLEKYNRLLELYKVMGGEGMDLLTLTQIH